MHTSVWFLLLSVSGVYLSHAFFSGLVSRKAYVSALASQDEHPRNYRLSKKYYDTYLKRIGKHPPANTGLPETVRSGIKTGNFTGRQSIWDYLTKQNEKLIEEIENQDDFDIESYINGEIDEDGRRIRNQTGLTKRPSGGLHIIINPGNIQVDGDGNIELPTGDISMEELTRIADQDTNAHRRYQRYKQHLESTAPKQKKSEHFEVVSNTHLKFADIGGYESVKRELDQCIDILNNHTKYARYNVRVPKGLIFEGPPGTGKTLLAKALAGEANTAFIAVSGSEFQEKYVGVGPARVRELFALAKTNKPCIVFIDEIDALGRRRSSDGEAASERDNTLNELLVALDGFKNTSGIFLVGATNRMDLLDPALIRPGRIDKRIYIGMPDAATRKAILKIHTRGKPCDITVNMDDLVEITSGLSGAQLENLVNEAMLNALREDREYFTNADVDLIMNKMVAGWQPIDHVFNDGIIHQIAIHEMGHSVVGLLSKHHSKMRKVIINLSSPTSPAYTLFEAASNAMSTREALFEHLMILLAGRIAEEVFFETSVSTGAINDFEEALKLAEKMILYYGMGKEVIYPSRSEKYKEIVDVEIADLLNSAYEYSWYILEQSKELMLEGAELLKRDKIVSAATLEEIMRTKYPDVWNLKIDH